MWQNRAALDDSNSLYKYLLRSVYNRALNYLDKNRRAGDYRAYYQERIASMGSAYYAPDNSPIIRKLYSDDLRASLDAAIESLPPKCREVFRLSYLEDLSNREISERLGISQSTVENHMYAALKQLRRKLSASSCCCCSPCCSCDRKKFAVPSRYFSPGCLYVIMQAPKKDTHWHTLTTPYCTASILYYTST